MNSKIGLFAVIFVIGISKCIGANIVCIGTEKIPHDGDCSHFYQCISKNEAEEMDCGRRIFHPQLKKCSRNYAAIKDTPCFKNWVPPNDLVPLGVLTTVPATVPTTVTPIIIANEEQFICTETGAIPYEGDCTKFYQCSKGRRATILNCPGGFEFDRERQICLFKSAVKNSACPKVEVSTTTSRTGPQVFPEYFSTTETILEEKDMVTMEPTIANYPINVDSLEPTISNENDKGEDEDDKGKYHNIINTINVYLNGTKLKNGTNPTVISVYD